MLCLLYLLHVLLCTLRKPCFVPLWWWTAWPRFDSAVPPGVPTVASTTVVLRLLLYRLLCLLYLLHVRVLYLLHLLQPWKDFHPPLCVSLFFNHIPIHLSACPYPPVFLHLSLAVSTLSTLCIVTDPVVLRCEPLCTLCALPVSIAGGPEKHPPGQSPHVYLRGQADHAAHLSQARRS